MSVKIVRKLEDVGQASNAWQLSRSQPVAKLVPPCSREGNEVQKQCFCELDHGNCGDSFGASDRHNIETVASSYYRNNYASPTTTSSQDDVH